MDTDTDTRLMDMDTDIRTTPALELGSVTADGGAAVMDGAVIVRSLTAQLFTVAVAAITTVAVAAITGVDCLIPDA
jgi:hypothetical protein